MSHYTANLRDLEFNLFEFLDTKDRFGTGPFEQMDAETARGVLAEIRKLAEGPIAASFTDADRNPPVFDPATHSVTLPESFKKSMKAINDGEWWRLDVPEHLGGFGAPHALTWAAFEMVLGANPAVFMYGSGAAFAAVLECLDRLLERLGQGHRVRGRVEDRRVAVGVGERRGQRTLGELADLGQHTVGGRGVHLLERPGAEAVLGVEELEEVELEVAEVGGVVAHCAGLPCSVPVSGGYLLTSNKQYYSRVATSKYAGGDTPGRVGFGALRGCSARSGGAAGPREGLSGSCAARASPRRPARRAARPGPPLSAVPPRAARGRR